MRIKLDENLPAKLASLLHALGHDVDTVRDEQLQGSDDPTVWKAAQNERRLLITQDLVFFRYPAISPRHASWDSPAPVARAGTNCDYHKTSLRFSERRCRIVATLFRRSDGSQNSRYSPLMPSFGK